MRKREGNGSGVSGKAKRKWGTENGERAIAHPLVLFRLEIPVSSNKNGVELSACMKIFPWNFARNVPLCLLTVGLTGCVLQTIKVKVVDADTGQPLAGATTLWRQDRYQMFETIAHSDLFREPPTGPDGTVEIVGTHRNWNKTLVFFCSGYSNGYTAYHGTMTLAPNIKCFPPLGYGDPYELDGKSPMETVVDRALDRINLITLNGEDQMIVKSNRCFIIPMQRLH